MARAEADESMEATCVLASASVNRFSSCSALIRSTLATDRQSDEGRVQDFEACMAFGAGKNLGIWWCEDPKEYRQITILKGHEASVTVVKSLYTPSGLTSPRSYLFGGFSFMSGDTKGGVRIWRGSQRDYGPRSWKCLVELPGHQRSISCLASAQLPPPAQQDQSVTSITQASLVVTGGSDGRIMIWTVTEACDHLDYVTATAKLQQTIECGNKISMDASLTCLPGQPDDFLLALAQTDSKIALYSLSLPTLLFNYVCALPGHTDWVRCLDFVVDPLDTNDLLLASGSQDGYIRLWRCSPALAATGKTDTKIMSPDPRGGAKIIDDPFKALDELTQTLKDEGKMHLASSSPSEDRSRRSGHLKVEMKKYPILTPSDRPSWNMTSEAVLFGHEGWVTNIHWALSPGGHLQLISTSSDRSMILWTPSVDHNGIWLNSERFGELTGSTNLGFFGAHYFVHPKNGDETVLASGWTGAWHRWGRCSSRALGNMLWEPQIAPTGHSQTITGIEWEREGDYLMSCSHDQTTRLWGPWKRQRPKDAANPCSLEIESWHELGRPQVHGHDLFGLSLINDQRTQFASISEEKVIRVFDTTERFIRLVDHLRVSTVPYPATLRKRCENVTLPPLGLSNKVEESTYPKEDEVETEIEEKSVPSYPPTEDELLTSTLWPEIEKVYGHPSELSAIASSTSGKLIASACHATSPTSASIRIHSTGSFRAVGVPLESHKLTVTQLAFNDDDSMLVSVSRDRAWTLWKPKRCDSDDESGQENTGWELIQKFEKAHGRIIWDVSWGPKGSGMFVTGSRDKTVKVWSRVNNGTLWECVSTITFTDAVRSCKLAPYVLEQKMLIMGIGLEDGSIHIYSTNLEQINSWKLVGVIDDQFTHTGPVERLEFCPKLMGPSQIRLASGGEDGVIRITDLVI